MIAASTSAAITENNTIMTSPSAEVGVETCHLRRRSTLRTLHLEEGADHGRRRGATLN
jgi:hypothetical protein